jgi:hypothetical protein
MLFLLEALFPMIDPEFSRLLEDYRAIELGAGRLMQEVCAPFCSVCPTPCCRTAICREAAESPFLLAVHGEQQAFDRKSGYLGVTGCKLGVGRPPVCHAYICHRIMSKQPDDERRYALDVLGDLVDYLGRGAWMKRHLVEAMRDADLARADREVFREQLATAGAVLEILEGCLGGERRLGAEELRVLGVIKRRAW